MVELIYIMIGDLCKKMANLKSKYNFIIIFMY